jgi:hypothetical protein
LFDFAFFIYKFLTTFVLTTGNWDRDNQEARYSAKVPLMALRVMAGFEKTDSYYLPRGRAHPSDELCSLIWPWLDGCLQAVEDSEGEHPTALHFLHFLVLLRSVILQDAAAMIVFLRRDEEEGGERRLQHALFDLPVFCSPLFVSFVDEMATLLVEEEGNDPNEMLIERALPGVNRRFDHVINLLQEMHGDNKETTKFSDDKVAATLEGIQDALKEQEDRAHKRHKETSSTIVGLLRQGADYIQKNEEESNEHTQQQQQSPQQPAESEVEGELENDEHEEDEADVLSRVFGRHVSFRQKNLKAMDLMDVYREFYGLGKFKGVPIEGGFNGLEMTYKNEWRGGYNSSDKIFFSRLKSMMAAMAKAAGVDEGAETSGLHAVASVWQGYLRSGGLAGCHKTLQGLGLISKKGSRARGTAAGS